jgi:hypothetical protein
MGGDVHDFLILWIVFLLLIVSYGIYEEDEAYI